MSESSFGVYPSGIVRVTATVDGDEREWYVPPDEANRDYQAYLAWVEEGNTATALTDPMEES